MEVAAGTSAEKIRMYSRFSLRAQASMYVMGRPTIMLPGKANTIPTRLLTNARVREDNNRLKPPFRLRLPVTKLKTNKPNGTPN